MGRNTKPSTINNVYPWGRSFDEYCRMFQLTAGDLQRRILGCADGPASFNAAMNRLGHHVISCDPLYQHDAGEIRDRIEAIFPEMLHRAASNRDRFVWAVIRSPEELGEVRREAMGDFLADYERGRESGRYLAEALPNLPFADSAFGLALCSHFLFLYSDELSTEDHLQSILELCRVAQEVRIFPVVDMRGNPSRHVDPIVQELRGRGLQTRLEAVAYEFQKGGNKMLTITEDGRGGGGDDPRIDTNDHE